MFVLLVLSPSGWFGDALGNGKFSHNTPVCRAFSHTRFEIMVFLFLFVFSTFICHARLHLKGIVLPKD